MLMPYVSFYFPRWRDDGRVWEPINLPFPFRALVKDTGMVHPTHACRADSNFRGQGAVHPDRAPPRQIHAGARGGVQPGVGHGAQVPTPGPSNLNQKSILGDFDEFWRHMPTKWLQERPPDSPTKGPLWILHFDPSLDALSLRSDVISLLKILSPGARPSAAWSAPEASRSSPYNPQNEKYIYTYISRDVHIYICIYVYTYMYIYMYIDRYRSIDRQIDT